MKPNQPARSAADLGFEALPDWADEPLSRDLPILRSRGEGQTLEYIIAYPQQASELGKEIAAFATSNAGTILLGIADDGALVGLLGVDSAGERDQLLRRIEGLCMNMVKPAITPTVAFAVEDQKTVLVMGVPKGAQPVYYCNGIPYVRHISSSRRAEPHEVLELITSSLVSGLDRPDVATATGTALRRLANSLANVVTDVLMLAEELEARSSNPLLQDLRSQYAQASEVARVVASTDDAEAEGLVNTLLAFAEAAEAVANYRLFLGKESWEGLVTAVRIAQRSAEEVVTATLARIDYEAGQRDWAMRRMRELGREVNQLLNRAVSMLNTGRVEELQQRSSTVGTKLLRLSYFGLHREEPDFTDALRAIGRELRLAETERLRMDGGASVAALLAHIERADSQLQTMLTLEGNEG